MGAGHGGRLSGCCTKWQRQRKAAATHKRHRPALPQTDPTPPLPSAACSPRTARQNSLPAEPMSWNSSLTPRTPNSTPSTTLVTLSRTCRDSRRVA